MIALFLLGAAAVLLLHSIIYERTWFRSLMIQVSFSKPHIYADESCVLTEVIENRKRMSVPLVEIAFRLPRGLCFDDAENILESDYVYKRDIFSIQGMEKIVRRYHVTAANRGYYSVSRLTCHAPSRMFSRTYMLDIDEGAPGSGLYVYAAHVDCSLLLRAVEVILGEHEAARNIYEDPFVFASIRPYTVQDPMKSVNWKAAAKTGELMVNTYASTSSVRVRIYLDVSIDEGNAYSADFRESLIAHAASLVRSLVKHQHDAGLVINCLSVTDDTHSHCVRFPSCISAGNMTAMEEYLTSDFNAAAVVSFEDMLLGELSSGTASGTSDEVYVFLAGRDTPSVRESALRLLGLNGSGVLAVPRGHHDTRREERIRNLHVLPI